MKDFKGKVAVITGAASGIGRATAERYVTEGMSVVLADVDEADLARAETELKAGGATVLGVRTDVSKRSDVEQLARRAFDAFGQVHLLFNNAGVGAGGAAWEATWNDWEWIMGVNLWGRDSRGQSVHAAHAGSEHGMPHHQHVVGRRACRRWPLGSIFGDEARSGGPLGEPVPDAPATELAGKGIRFSTPAWCGQISQTPSAAGPRNCVMSPSR